jgi:adenylyltransferase/sulfurtransferase
VTGTGLTDAQIERYSRQIILPEVGARGQERLLAARVAVTGAGIAAAATVTLLGRAGVGALDVPDDMPPLPELSPDCRIARGPASGEAADVAADFSGDPRASAALGGGPQASGRPLVLGALRGARVTVATLVGRPCIACIAPADVPAGADPGPLGGPVALALGALAASEVLRLLLLPGAPGRITTLAVDTGACRAVEPTPVGGCPLCGGSA